MEVSRIGAKLVDLNAQAAILGLQALVFGQEKGALLGEADHNARAVRSEQAVQHKSGQNG